MANRYYDAGSGPHDPASTVNDRGERNCGCRHDGHSWVSLCDTARQAADALHALAAVQLHRSLTDSTGVML